MDAKVHSVSDPAAFIAPVLLAFASDPFVRWLIPDPDAYLRCFGAITSIHAERAGATGGAFGLEDGRGAAFWYVPGESPPMERIGPLFAEAGALDRARAVFGAAAEFEPAEPHWYLRQIGIDPAVQSAGRGALLLEAPYQQIDAGGHLAYLEATSPRGRDFYARHGFEVVGEVTADGSPPLWAMVRTPGATAN